MADKPVEVRIEVEIRTWGPTHFGSGFSRPLVHNAVVVDSGGHSGRPDSPSRHPFIPGSTIKGIARHACEDVARLIGEGACMSPKPENMCLSGSMCRVCRIFGSPWHPSPIRFHHARPSRNLPIGVRNRVAMSRVRGVAMEGHLFTMEATTEDPTAFRTDITGHLCGDEVYEDVAFLIAGLRLISRMGGGKSVGFGRCDVVISKVSIDGRVEDVNSLLDLLPYSPEATDRAEVAR